MPVQVMHHCELLTWIVNAERIREAYWVRWNTALPRLIGLAMKMAVNVCVCVEFARFNAFQS